MGKDSIGVAVIGAGMAGRAHAGAYRSVGTVFGTDGPEVRLVAIADLNEPLAEDTRRRYGFQRTEADWRALLDAEDVDAVSVVVANALHREIAEALFAAGKHVLCEKPLAPSTADARAMADAADRSGLVAAVGYTYRRAPALCAIREELGSGRLGTPVHFNGHVWHDYALDPMTPMTWRYRGGPGSGVLADTGSHLVDAAEYVCGPITEVSGAMLTTVIAQRPIPAGATIGHGKAELTGEFAPVENEDLVGFTARFANGALGTFSVSRVAHAQPNGLAFEVFCTEGSAAFDLQRTGEFVLSDNVPEHRVNGRRQVLVSPEHPYIHRGLAMDSAGVGHGTDDMFVYQNRSFLDQIAGVETLPRCASFRDAVHGMEILDAVVESALSQGGTVKIG